MLLRPIFILVFAVFLCGSSLGQTTPETRIGTFVRTAIPTTDFEDYVNMGAGAGFRLSFQVRPKIRMGLSMGYIRFTKNQVTPNLVGEAIQFPFMGDVQFFLFNDHRIRPWIGLEIGYSALLLALDYQPPGEELRQYDRNYNGVNVAAAIGAEYKLSKQWTTALKIDYAYILNAAQLGVLEQDFPDDGSPEGGEIIPFNMAGINLSIAYSFSHKKQDSSKE